MSFDSLGHGARSDAKATFFSWHGYVKRRYGRRLHGQIDRRSACFDQTQFLDPTAGTLVCGELAWPTIAPRFALARGLVLDKP